MTTLLITFLITLLISYILSYYIGRKLHQTENMSDFIGAFFIPYLGLVIAIALYVAIAYDNYKKKTNKNMADIIFGEPKNKEE